jgi:two-component system, LuxR family, response regulator FixJ
LIVDVNMPDMNGLDVVEELRRRGDALPVIIVIAHTDGAARVGAAAAGAIAFLEKPHGADEVLAWCAKSLALRILRVRASSR